MLLMQKFNNREVGATLRQLKSNVYRFRGPARKLFDFSFSHAGRKRKYIDLQSRSDIMVPANSK